LGTPAKPVVEIPERIRSDSTGKEQEKKKKKKYRIPLIFPDKYNSLPRN